MVSSATSALALLTDLLTTGVDNAGRSWNLPTIRGALEQACPPTMDRCGRPESCYGSEDSGSGPGLARCSCKVIVSAVRPAF